MQLNCDNLRTSCDVDRYKMMIFQLSGDLWLILYIQDAPKNVYAVIRHLYLRLRLNILR